MKDNNSMISHGQHCVWFLPDTLVFHLLFRYRDQLRWKYISKLLIFKKATQKILAIELGERK